MPRPSRKLTPDQILHALELARYELSRRIEQPIDEEMLVVSVKFRTFF
ncbi:hypothetical protein OpiT1DRAFT_05451 [Opitutaceae bacterium TAV1]|nr:hypothetical protein OpiT1DRAFT_05446 [Opitutaceae bacterium TAV1]EIQ00894.1 hypothetical protein OpiT1DRAFT_05451 [Opitutaceae bacterium TAV1]